jgi:hypothetical protein
MTLRIPRRLRALEPRLAALIYSTGLVAVFGGMVLDSVPLVVAGGAVGLLADVPAMLRPITKRSQLAGLGTVLTRQVGRGCLLLVAMVAVTQTRVVGVMIAGLVTVLCIAAAHGGYRVLSSIRLRRWSALFQRRNVDVPGSALLPRSSSSGELAVGAISYLVAELSYLLALALLQANSLMSVLTMLLACLIAVCATAAALVPWRRSPTPAQADAANAALRAALRSFAPQVVVYFSSPASGTYALRAWTEVINALRVPTLVILREPVHLDQLGDLRVPIVVLPSATDVESFHLESMRVVLYPTNVIQNNHMVRLPGLLHCFIGHGDSDKAGSFSPVSRMYDEIWVAGQAAVDRYAAAAEGFLLDRIRIVGRPQLAHILPGTAHTADDRLTVLYAPTWEGFFELSDYSSVAPMGREMVSALLRRGVRVLYKPHPATGQRLAGAVTASSEIEAMIAAAGDGHQVVPATPHGLYGAFNEADVLITDVSSVITDFLASRKPLIVTNPRRFDVSEFHTLFPSTKAGYVLDKAAQLDGALDDIVTGDSAREQRERYAGYLLGDTHGDPFAFFLDEVERCVVRADEERARRDRARAMFEGSTPWLAS